jgi:hypothetical protein
MEDVLDLYAEPFDPKRPWVCFDERPCQLVGDVLAPLPMKPGKPKRIDNEYERKRGIVSGLVAVELGHIGRRHGGEQADVTGTLPLDLIAQPAYLFSWALA